VTVSPEHIRLPYGLDFYEHQVEADRAFDGGARWGILCWHRQGGKGLYVLTRTIKAAFEVPGTYAIVSPTFRMSRENFWDARDPRTGRLYLDAIPLPLVVDRNESEMSIVIRTQVPGQTSRIIFLSADDEDRLRGLALAGCVLDEFASMAGRGPFDVVRVSLAASGGWLIITSTPKGLNHFYEVWRNAEGAGGWYLSRKTIEDTHRHDGTPIIPLAYVEQERKEGQREEWLQQELYCAFTAALVSSYYGDLLTKAEQDGRILDLPHRSETRVLTSWDLGFRDSTVVLYVQERGEYLDVFDCDAFEGLSLPEILARVNSHHYHVRDWLAPHDLGQHEFGSGQTPREIAANLGVHFTVVPRLDVQSGIDAVRRLFSRLRFDRRRCAKLLEAVAGYQKVWDAQGKMFKDKPLHSWHSHYADALRVLATADLTPAVDDPKRQRFAKVQTDLFARPGADTDNRRAKTGMFNLDR
jgi:phage terminase large subunit